MKQARHDNIISVIFAPCVFSVPGPTQAPLKTTVALTLIWYNRKGVGP